MKQITKLIMALIACTLLAQADTLKENMATMQQGMELIQNGFINNSQLMIQEGITHLMSATKAYEKLSGERTHLKNVAITDLANIEKSVKKMTEYLATKDYTKAAHTYGDVLVNCARCHAVVRKW